MAVRHWLGEAQEQRSLSRDAAGDLESTAARPWQLSALPEEKSEGRIATVASGGDTAYYNLDCSLIPGWGITVLMTKL